MGPEIRYYVTRGAIVVVFMLVLNESDASLHEKIQPHFHGQHYFQFNHSSYSISDTGSTAFVFDDRLRWTEEYPF